MNLIERAEKWIENERVDSETYELVRDLLAVAKRLPRDANGNPLVPGEEVRLVGMGGVGEIEYAGAYDKVLVNDSTLWPDASIKVGVLCMRDGRSLALGATP
jgi:hypothetical protein